MKAKQIFKAHGVAPKSIAEELQISPQAVRKWNRVPPKHCPIIEARFGVPRHVMRPDIYGISPPTADTTSEITAPNC